MSTDEDLSTEGLCLLALISYLERNDFTSIRQISRHILHTKDGKRDVHLWFNATRFFPTGQVTVPGEFLKMAEHVGARPDVVCMVVTDNRVNLVHIMNAVPA